MVILGLGSNLGDRLHHLKNAFKRIQQIPQLTVKNVSPIYVSDALLPENAPSNWNLSYFNLALRCETTISPYDLLNHVKKIEKELGRTPSKDWGPRLIDIDILAWDNLVQYDQKLHLPHEYLGERPFALWPLADIAPNWVHPILQKTAAEMVLPWGSRLDGKAPLHTRQIQQRIDTPELVGILNITPDSFSDGNKYRDVAEAIACAHHLIQEGAVILDIGAEATGPSALPLSKETEWKRLEPFLTALLPELSGMLIKPKISIDTRHSFVAEKCLRLFNVDIINDVSGLTDKNMQKLIAQNTCDVIVMHHLTIPEERTFSLPQNEAILPLLYKWANEKINHLEEMGISRSRIIFDSGIGYGKTAEQSLELIKESAYFKNLGVRLLIGHSRKSFLKRFTNHLPLERDLESVIVSLHLAKQNIDYLRIHNVSAHSRAFKVSQYF